MCTLDEATELRYAGPVNVTSDGIPCLDWDLMPTFAKYPLWDALKTPERNWTLAQSYCRNYDFDPYPICFVGFDDWRYCDSAPNCGKHNSKNIKICGSTE